MCDIIHQEKENWERRGQEVWGREMKAWQGFQYKLSICLSFTREE